MKLLVAGGRKEVLSNEGYKLLDGIYQYYRCEELVNGGATGIDECARDWAKWGMVDHIPIKLFLPNWSRGKIGGPERNRKMSEYCKENGVCVLFKGGRGTNSMFEEAKRSNMVIIDIRQESKYTL